MFKGGVGNGLEGCVNEEAVTPDIRGRVQARGQQPPSGKSESGNPLYLDPLSRQPNTHLITCRFEVNRHVMQIRGEFLQHQS